MLSRTTEQGSNKTMELRQHSGRNQLTTVGGGGRTLVDGTVNEPASVTVQVGSTAAAQPARVTSQSPSGPYRFQREADFPVGWTSLTITATDGSNNISTKTYNVSVSDAETRSLAYDSNGNLKTKTYLRSGTSYRVETYTWDAENRLTGWQDKTLATPTAPEIITASSTWQYDGQGRRVKEHNVQGTTITDNNILWSGLEMIQWQNPDGSVARNLFATGEQQPTSSLQPQASSLIYLPDHLGSIRGWYNPVDNAKGSADYSAYGTRTITANTASFTPARSFTGHYQHEASGLVLAPYRAYDAELGRWISEDPIAERGGMNWYLYVSGNPVNATDASGLVGSGIVPTKDGWVNMWTGESGHYTGTNKIDGPVSGVLNFLLRLGDAKLGDCIKENLNHLLPQLNDTTTPTNVNIGSFEGVNISDTWNVGLTLGDFRYTKQGDRVTVSDEYAFPLSQSDWHGGTSYHNTALAVILGWAGKRYKVNDEWVLPGSQQPQPATQTNPCRRN